MGEAKSSSIIARKTETGRETHNARSMTVQKALRLTIAKVAEEMMDLALAALAISVDKVGNDDLDEVINAENLLVFIESRGRDVGLVMLDAALVGALVQQQTMKQVMPDAAPTDRQMTRTDAALAAPLLDEFMSRLERVIEKRSDALLFSGYQFGDIAEDKRIALMALEATEYKAFNMTLDVARGARQGKITLLLPPYVEPELLPEKAESGADIPAPPKREMTDTVLRLEADLTVVLAKLRMTLGEAQLLQPGDALQLPMNSFPKVTLQTRVGKELASGVLGQLDGVRAVQVEHERPVTDQPKRRARDRDDLDLPDVTGAGNATAPSMGLDLPDVGMGLPDDLPAPGMDLPDLPDLPDMPLPDLDLPDAAPGLPEPGGFEDEELPELDDLPDLGDLPDLADLPDLKMA